MVLEIFKNTGDMSILSLRLKTQQLYNTVAAKMSSRMIKNLSLLSENNEIGSFHHHRGM
jgi:hypothetical protein